MKTDTKSILDLIEKIVQAAKIALEEDKPKDRTKGGKKKDVKRT
jgi:hypothetical protein